MKAPILRMIGRIVLLTALTACDFSQNREYVERSIITNAAFSPSTSSIILAETRFMALSPYVPWWATEGRDWVTVFYSCNRDFSEKKELARFSEGNVRMGGNIQAVPLYWLEDARKVITNESGYGVIYHLDSQTRQELALPPEQKGLVFNTDNIDLQDAAFAEATIPSPNGEFVAVLWTAVYELEGDPFFYLRFVHALAFYSASDGQLLRVSPIADYRHLDAEPRLKSIEFPDDLDKDLDYLPAHFSPKFLWAKDSASVYLILSLKDIDETSRNVVVKIDAKTDSVQEVYQLPERQIPTKGGAIDADGTFILRNNKNSRQAFLILKKAMNWKGFDELEEIDIAKIPYI